MLQGIAFYLLATVAVLGGGVSDIYPPEHAALLTQVMEGLTVQEQCTAADLMRALGLFAATGAHATNDPR